MSRSSCLAPVLLAVLIVSGTAWSQTTFTWDRLPDLPDALGVAGPFVGTPGGDRLLVAGGANFPRPVWETEKAWRDPVWLLERDGDAWGWRQIGTLDEPIGYGSAVTLGDGVLCLGGCDRARVSDAVRLLTPTPDGLRTVSWPPLPFACAFGAAARIGDHVYLAAGQTGVDAATATKRFVRLDVTSQDRRWEELPPWPGPSRVLPVGFAAPDGHEVAFHLASGRRRDGDSWQLLRDAYRFSPSRHDRGLGGAWTRLSDTPECLMAGSAVAFGETHVAVFGGDDGALFGRANDLRDDHPGFTRDAWLYHPVTDRWRRLTAELPLNQVTTAAVLLAGGIVVPSGEVRPRVRTPRIWKATPPPRRSAGLSVIDYAVIGVYLLSLVAMGFWFSRRENTTNDFFLGGHRVPWWAAGLSVFGTQLSAITFMAIPAHVYSRDWVYFIGSLTIVAAAPIVSAVYIPRLRKTGAATAYQLLEERFSLPVRLLGSAAFCLFQLGRMGIVLYLPALALSAVTGLDVYLCIGIMGLLATIYTVLGGIEAVIWTDVVQVFVLLGGAVVALVIIVADLDSVTDAFAAAGDAGKLRLVDDGWSMASTALWVVILGRFMEQLIPYTSDQTVVQRYLTTPDVTSARRALWTNAALSVPATLIFFAIGSGLWAFYREHPDRLDIAGRAGDVFPWFIATELPVGVAGLVIAGLFAASMSSLDSSMNSIATAITTDWIKRLRPGRPDATLLRTARVLTLLLGVLGTVFAWWMAALSSTSLWDSYSRIIGLLGSGLAGLFVLAVFVRRATPASAVVGFAGSAVTLAVVRASFARDIHFFLYPAIGIGVCVLLGWALGRSARVE